MAAKIEAVIHLDHIRHNLARVRALAPRSRVLAVVKADAYGHGVAGVLPALDGADAFAVAHIDEAVALRALTVKPIVILEGFLDAAEWEQCRADQLTPVLHDPAQIALVRQSPPAAGQSLWLKLDTGMHRLGFDAAGFAAACAALRALDPAPALTAMTHFARSEETGHPLTPLQIAAFDAANTLALPASMANSGGIIHWPQSHREWVRPGLMLYGVAPAPCAIDLRPAMTLRSRVIAVRDVRAGDDVGYNGRWTAPRDGRIATIAAGYADGYPTQVPNGTRVLVNGHAATLAGRPSMDMITVDVSDMPAVRPGDDALLWGAELPVTDIAARAGTISYHLLTGVTKRVTRRYD